MVLPSPVATDTEPNSETAAENEGEVAAMQAELQNRMRGAEPVAEPVAEPGAEPDATQATRDLIDCSDAEFGRTALWWAAANGHLEVVRLLVAARAGQTQQGKHWGNLELKPPIPTGTSYTARDVAKAHGHEKCAGLLVGASSA